jgi:membrane protein
VFSLPDRPRDLLREVLRGYARVDLLTYANAIAFQVLFALIPALLCLLGALGFLGLDDVYSEEVVPSLREGTSEEVFAVLDQTFRQVLGSGEVFWITLGLALTVWKLGGAMRATMGVLERVYDGEGERGALDKYALSTWLAVAASLLLLGAAVAVRLLPPFAAWPLALALMAATVALVVHFAPLERPPWQFVSLGTVIVVTAWALTSLAFGFYVSDIADFGSVFGNLATVVILFEYLYLAACAFLTGALLDQIVRGRDA